MTTAGARGSLSLVDPDETLPPEAPPTIPAPPPSHPMPMFRSLPAFTQTRLCVSDFDGFASEELDDL